MVIDISSYNGRIDWAKVSKAGVTGVILRATTQNGQLDTRFMENYNGILQNMNDNLTTLAVYKFAYTRDYAAAYCECRKCLNTLKAHGVRLETLDCLYCDVEKWGGREYTKDEINAVFAGYKRACDEYGVRFGMYFNYNYAKNYVDAGVWSNERLWYARYNSFTGDISPFKIHLWQYTSKGKIDGITGDVDISKGVNE